MSEPTASADDILAQSAARSYENWKADHPTASAGEWTPESVRALVGYDIGGSGTIARAHNAALKAKGDHTMKFWLRQEERHKTALSAATARELHSYDVAKKCRDELAAEREKMLVALAEIKAVEHKLSVEKSVVRHLDNQLAAEREVTQSWFNKSLKLEAQLAAEQKMKWELAEQLAAAQEKIEQLQDPEERNI